MSDFSNGTLQFNQATRQSLAFSNEAMKEVKELLSHYPSDKSKSALIPILHIAQSEFDGWLSPEAMDYVASLLNISSIEVFEVASFYTMFNLKPVGNCLLEVCQTSSCWLKGSDNALKYLEQKLGIKPGETTADGFFTLKTVECLGSCGTAPMMQCGAAFHENLNEDKLDEIIETYQAKGKRTFYTDLQAKHTK